MKEQDIQRILAQIESWMLMTCASCAMPEKIQPLLEKIRKLLESEGDQPMAPLDSGKTQPNGADSQAVIKEECRL